MTRRPLNACSLLPAAAAALLLAALPAAAPAQVLPEGYLCCNLRSDGRWISDSNYAESGKFVIPAGTPIKALSYARYRVEVELPAGGSPHASGRQTLANDYSRELPMEDFARRWIVPEDPRRRLAEWPAEIRDAVTSARVMRGMTREQVLMAVGYPIASENPHLDQPVWRYWLWSFQPFTVHFNAQGLVQGVQTDADTRRRVVKE